MALPEAFCLRMKALLGEDAEAFFSSLEKPPSRAFRYDPAKVSRNELQKAFGEALGNEIPFLPNALRFHGEGIGNLPLHHGGALYVQEPAAMAPVAAAMPRKVGRILDLCAAPGGKSLQAAALLLEDEGVLICNEPEGKRRKVLMQNLERMGEGRCQVTGFDARSLPKSWEERFDLVICDAPCSGEGMMRKHSAAAELWSLENIREGARRQKEILQEAVRILAPGGILIYSTCTWAPEENEEQVTAVLETYPQMHLIPPSEAVTAVSAPGISQTESPYPLFLTRRFYPHLFDGEGQYLALLEKEEGAKKERKQKKKTQPKPSPQEKVALEFLQKNLTSLPVGTFLTRGDEVYLVPKGGVDPEETVSPGILLGTVQKGRLVPHHRLFLACGALFSKRISLEEEDARVEAYLRGEEIPLEGAGFALLLAGDCPLGGVKISGGRGKNLYPKGLRKV